MKKAQPI